jgi:hypothetical protein
MKRLTHSVASTDKFVAMHSGNSRLATWQAAILGPEGTPMRQREFIMLLGGAVAARRAGAAKVGAAATGTLAAGPLVI